VPFDANLVEPCEGREETSLILQCDAATVVMHPEADLSSGLGGGTQLNARRLAAIFESVAEIVQLGFFYPRLITLGYGPLSRQLDLSLCLGNHVAETTQNLGHNAAHV
jgi:hypothetical protein